ncbi:two-component sensor histidine kinase [Arsenicitalea aurantiaca]|uniref:histidine kinase n=1 Tax=Arsenicitalea aurantiaca TaxID=1783274 RepID=A0A433XB82_9HYPH|nr:ATP-binding protein [Arsenicitalea aurantiaca]RUT31335.1 two-component sensor histidine kinase [Arsenicitalea aurantiaca]
MAPTSPTDTDADLPRGAGLLARIIGHVTHLAAVAGVMLALVLIADLSLVHAGIGFLALAVVILALPQPTTVITETVTVPAVRTDGRAEYRRMADALAEPCLLLDARSLVLHANPPALTQFPSLKSGVPIAFALRHPSLLSAIDEVVETGAPLSIELNRSVPTESIHKVDISRIGPEDGSSPIVVLTLRDRTEERRVDAMRSDFIANASHELRTPLTSLVGFIDTLLGPAANDPAARARFLGIMQAQAARMSKLIDDLLSLSRIEMRQHMRPRGQVDVGALLAQVREGLQTQAKAAALSIEIKTPETPVVVTGEREELYEVFENLLDNAIKYGEGGGSVEIAVGPAEGRHGFDYSVTITDHGPGIAAEHVPRLTERFYRVDAESSRKKKGTGLGLAIVKHILTRHRGQLAIRSTPGEGTQVEVLLVR